MHKICPFTCLCCVVQPCIHCITCRSQIRFTKFIFFWPPKRSISQTLLNDGMKPSKEEVESSTLIGWLRRRKHKQHYFIYLFLHCSKTVVQTHKNKILLFGMIQYIFSCNATGMPPEASLLWKTADIRTVQAEPGHCIGMPRLNRRRVLHWWKQHLYKKWAKEIRPEGKKNPQCHIGLLCIMW